MMRCALARPGRRARRILTSEAVIASRTAQHRGGKLIPIRVELKAFRAAVLPWLADLAAVVRRVAGKAYVSVGRHASATHDRRHSGRHGERKRLSRR